MQLNLMPFLGLEIVLVAVVIAMVFWRQAVARKEDDTLHVLHGALSEQTTVAAKLEKIDRWGKTLTIVTVIFGVAIGAIFVYQTWMQSATSVIGD